MAASSPRNDLVKNSRVHPTHWLISTQHVALSAADSECSSFCTVRVSVSVKLWTVGSGLHDSLIQHRLSGPRPWHLKPARDGWQ